MANLRQVLSFRQAGLLACFLDASEPKQCRLAQSRGIDIMEAVNLAVLR